jgi:hypothetical protein
MTVRGPDFDALVGSDLDPGERERLRRVHDLLVTAGPPPELEPTATTTAPVVDLESSRRRPALVALAAALGVLVFALGVLVGNSDEAESPARTVAMAGVGAASDASGSLALFPGDEAGNWPMELSVEGLAPSDPGYELWLTKEGRRYALCGSFRVAEDGSAVVPMNAPYELDESAGWVVVERGSEQPLLTT